MSDLDDLERLVHSATPLLFIDTHDIERVQGLCERLATRCARPLFRWTLAHGLQRLDQTMSAQRFNSQPADVLGQMLAVREPGIYLMLDLARCLDDALTVSQMRELGLREAGRAHTVVIAGPGLRVPPELRGMSAQMTLSLPTIDRLRAIVDAEAEDWGRRRGRRVQATLAAIEALVRNLVGLSEADARRLVRHAIADDGVLDENDLPAVQAAKYQLLDQGGVLSFELDTARMADVAGLSRLKTWLAQRKAVFLAGDAPPGLDPPKGLLLLGIQGGGKSLAAKSVAGSWGVPLLRLDFAALYNKYYGETERNLREALQTASVMAPCVLWIDEIEKGLASEGDDGGPGRRLLGTLLTWMAERRDKVFLVATANDIEQLPPELLRKGRFDEIFFVDLPSPAVREAIFDIHLRRRGQDPAGFDLAALAAASAGFSGAEIEQAVVAGLYAAHAEQQSLDTAAIVREVQQTRPLSVVMAEKMLALRVWAAQRTVPADEPAADAHDESNQ